LPDIHLLAEKILMESIKYPTVLGESYKEMVEYYAGVLRDYGIHVTIHRVPDDYVRSVLPGEYHPERPRYILLARWGSGSRVLQFNGHYDVVFPGEGWTVTDPFKPVKKNGRIYGRGSSDMKGGIAAFLAAMIHYASRNIDPGIVVEAAVVPDEEIGGKTGTGYLVEKLGSRPDWVVIAEPSGIDNIWHGHKGLVWAEVLVKGKQTHGSTPWLGVNAFEKMIHVAEYLFENYLPKLREKKSSYNYDIPGAEHPTATLGGKLISPGSINILPGIAGFSIDRRLIVEEKAEDIVKELTEYIREAARKAEADVETRIVSKMDPALTPPDSEIITVLEEAIRSVLGLEPRKTICVGGLDLRYYSQKGIQVATYGPGDPETPHKVDEYITVANLHKTVDVYIKLIEMLGAKYRGK
jgi:succinyl-diaminopimelate desuccinylase